MGKIKPPHYQHRSNELRLGRNYVRHGDLVRITPPPGSPKGAHGYLARFQYSDVDKGGLFACVLRLEKNEKGILLGAGFAFVVPERIERKATTHDPNRAVVERAAARKARKS